MLQAAEAASYIASQLAASPTRIHTKEANNTIILYIINMIKKFYFHFFSFSISTYISIQALLFFVPYFSSSSLRKRFYSSYFFPSLFFVY
jgi:hypothetical protein